MNLTKNSISVVPPNDILTSIRFRSLNTRPVCIKSRHASDISDSNLGIGCETLDRDYADYHAYKQYLGNLGAKRVRLQSGWAKTEYVKGKYDFSWLDEIVDDVVKQGMFPWMEISYGNPIYEGGGGISLGGNLPTSKEAVAAWKRYVAVLVLRYRDRVDTWEVWNEPDCAKIPVEDYTDFYIETASCIRQIQPDALLIALALAYSSSLGYLNDFLDRLGRNDLLNLVDYICFHGYPPNPDHEFKNIEEMQKIIKNFSPSIRLWEGETGAPSTLNSSGALSGCIVSEKMQAKWILRRALNFLIRNIPFTLFTFSDFYYPEGLNSKGLLKIRPDFSIERIKPSYIAYQNLTAIFDYTVKPVNLNFTKLCSEYVTLCTFTSGKNIIVLWRSTSIPSDIDDVIFVDLVIDEADFLQPVYCSLIDGIIDIIPDTSMVVDNKKLTLKQVPIYDTPVLIAEKDFFM